MCLHGRVYLPWDTITIHVRQRISELHTPYQVFSGRELFYMELNIDYPVLLIIPYYIIFLSDIGYQPLHAHECFPCHYLRYMTWYSLTTEIVALQCLTLRDAAHITWYFTPSILSFSCGKTILPQSNIFTMNIQPKWERWYCFLALFNQPDYWELHLPGLKLKSHVLTNHGRPRLKCIHIL